MANKMTQEQFLERCKKVHGDRYDYSLVKYSGMRDPVQIICKEHGLFLQSPMSHVQGKGCQKCGKHSESKKFVPEKWYKKLAEKFGTRFDLEPVLSLASYEHPLVLTCQEHGPFSTTLNAMLHPKSKYGCPICGRLAGNKNKNKKTLAEFVEKAKAVHGDKYSYDLVEYAGTFSTVKIICPVHGVFEQEARVHLSGHGCQKCGKDLTSAVALVSKEEFVLRSTALHGHKFDYTKTQFTKLSDTITVTCLEHGDFETTGTYHLAKVPHNRGGCPICDKERRKESAVPFSEFLSRARALYGEAYTYANYAGIQEQVTVVCPKHGELQQLAYVHLRGGGCQICSKSKNNSAEEVSLFEALSSEVKLVSGDRKLISPMELDMVCHEHKFAVEYCGLYWHSEGKGVGKSYHLAKHLRTEEAGYRLFTVFSDEWLNNPDVVKAVILRAVSSAEVRRIGARKCSVVEVPSAEARAFYDKYHLQGHASGAHYGLRLGDELLACATVGRRAIYGGASPVRAYQVLSGSCCVCQRRP